MVAAECTKRIECRNCETKFTLIYDREEVEDKPEYCPFCGDLYNDAYDDEVDDEEQDEDDEEYGW